MSRPEPGQLRANAELGGKGMYLVFERNQSYQSWFCLIIEADPEYPHDPEGSLEDIAESWLTAHTSAIV